MEKSTAGDSEQHSVSPESRRLCLCEAGFQVSRKPEQYLKKNCLLLDAGINSFFWVKAYLHRSYENSVTTEKSIKLFKIISTSSRIT